MYRLLQERLGWSEPAAWRATTQAATLVFFAIAAVILAWFWWADRRATTQMRLMTDYTASEGPNAHLAGVLPDALFWRGAIAVTLAYLLIGSFWFQHWYLLWVLALAVLPAYCLGAF